MNERQRFLDSLTYYSVVIPHTANGTQWHPTDPTGPFSTLVRGAFRTLDDVHTWAKANIPGFRYTVNRTDRPGTFRYSGFGMGHYVSVSGTDVWCDRTEANRLADRELVGPCRVVDTTRTQHGPYVNGKRQTP